MNRRAPHGDARWIPAVGCIPIVAVFAAFPPAGLHAQVTPPPPPGQEFATVIPAAHCGAGRVFAALAGRGYRELWTAPITVPVADLDRLGGGGLTPLRVGGGVTTQTLHMRGADGRRYVFRSVQKVTRQALAEEFWGTPVEAIMRDQLCSFHPSGAVVVARLLDAVGVLHTEPQFLVVPDDPRLGEFREQFAGMLVLFEERPDEPAEDGTGFAGSDRIVQIENLFDDLESDPRERVEVAELLKSRLIDVLVGDRDRSINNHLWARFDEPGGGHLWRPIPRDRDQSFVRFDGAVKALGRRYEPRLVSFGDEYSDIEGLTRVAWDIDRTLLVRLDRDDWDGIVRGVQDAITDDVIAAAVRRMPEAHYARVGAAIEASLRSRRDALTAAAARMYEIIFRYADIHATDADEAALVEGVGGGVRLALHRKGTGSGREGPPHFDRVFSPGETREIRIYLHGGDDVIRVEGRVESPILVRVIGGGGRDELVNVSGRDRVYFYDGGEGTQVTGERTRRVRRNPPRLYSWWVDGEGELDWGTRSIPLPAMSYDGDRGLVVGFGLRHDRYGFLRQPFSARVHATMGWAVGRSQPIIDYRHYLQNRIGNGDLEFQARYTGVEIVRFYGLGNETAEAEDASFHEVHQKQLTLGADLSFGDGVRRRLGVGPVFRHTSSDTSDAATFIAVTRPYGTGTFSQAGLRVVLDLDGREIRGAPARGYRIEAGAAWYPEVLDVESSFGEVHGEAALYASPASGNPTLAVRAGGRKLWGTFPYSDAAFLGGSDNVRGLREQRFAGDAAAWGSAELRVFLARVFLLLPIDIGVLGLTDVGRVFLNGESSDRWHGAWGGGLWLAPLNREATVHLSVARHDARMAVHMGMGFAF